MNIVNKLKKKTDLGVSIIFIIGILIVVNFFSYQIFYRWDLTQNKDYSISKVSKRTAGQLDDIVNIKAYFSKNLPSQFITLRQEVGDILDEYSAYANNNIRIEFINPGDDENIERELYVLGIPQLQFNVLEKDKYQMVKGYLGMVVQHGDKTEVIPVVQDTRNLEYQITLAIKKVTSEEMSTIGLVTSHGCVSAGEISQANKKLAELYEVVDVTLEAENKIPAGINTLVIIGPQESFSQEQLQEIDLFIANGGSLLLLADGVKVGEGLAASVNDVNLNSLLKNYGIKLNNDLVLDVSSGMASFNQGYVTFTTNYPFWPKVLGQNFDQGTASVARLESLILPWASSLEVLSDQLKDNSQVSYLAKTTNKAWKQADNFNLNPQQGLMPNSQIDQYNLAIAISAKINNASGQGSASPETAGLAAGRLIVVGDSDFMRDNFVRNFPENLIFFQNLVDSLSLDEDLINIRSKGVTDRPIKELSEGIKVAVRYLNIFGLTIIVVLFGMIRYFIRRRSKFIDEL